MAQLILTEAGAFQMLKQSMGLERPEPIKVCLYINPHQPSRKDEVLHYVEMASHGYTPRIINQLQWRPAQLEGGVKIILAPPLIWTFNADTPVSVYGSFAVGVRRPDLLYWIDPLEKAPVLVEARGQQIEIQPCLGSVLAPMVS